MRLKLGFSTCPNDTFIFDALVHHKIDTEGLEWDLTLADVEELNEMAFAGALDITKLSYHAYAYIAPQYQLLDSGSALGRNNGPLLISKKNYSVNDVDGLRIAIPGDKTTANLLLKIAFPNAKSVHPILFSDIEHAVFSGEYDAGLIIHENRFTYQDRGLHKIVDLGEFWEQHTHSPIPLGGIVIQRQLSDDVKAKFARVLRRSVLFAMQHPSEAVSYMQKYAQEMAAEIMAKHINLYVNNFTASLGTEGRAAIELLYQKAFDLGKIPTLPSDIFLD